MRVRISFMLLVLVLVLAGSSISQGATYPSLPTDGPSVQLDLTHTATENSPTHAFTLLFKEAVETNSDGKITVNIYPNGQLGSDSEIAASCQLGNIPMVYQAASTHATLVPEASLFDTPFLLTNYDMDVVKRVCIDSPFREKYNEVYDAAGFKLLTISAGTSTSLSSNTPIESMEDLQGLKIRTAQAQSRMAIWTALGANPTPLAYGELYMALQQGLVTASDNTFANMVSAKLVEQQKYIFKSEHFRPNFSLLMSKKFFDELPKAYQDYILAVTKDLNDDEFDLYIKDDLEAERIIREEYKLEFCNISDAFRAEMQEKAKPAVEATKKLVANDEVFDLIVGTLEEYAK